MLSIFPKTKLPQPIPIKKAASVVDAAWAVLPNNNPSSFIHRTWYIRPVKPDVKKRIETTMKSIRDETLRVVVTLFIIFPTNGSFADIILTKSSGD